MCLNCGCMQAHNDHGKPVNITYEDVQQAAEANAMIEGLKATLAMIERTAKKDRKDHPVEYKKAATQRGHVGDVLATVKDGESPSGPVSQGLV